MKFILLSFFVLMLVSQSKQQDVNQIPLNQAFVESKLKFLLYLISRIKNVI
jgi:hypothetical protein